MPVARVALPVAATATFDYWVPDGLAVARGSIVRVALGARRLTGVVADIALESVIAREKLQPIARSPTDSRCPTMSSTSPTFVASYYQEPLGLALALAVPPLAGADSVRAHGRCDLRLTAQGAAALPGKLTRAPAARALFDQFSRVAGMLAATEIAQLPPHGKRTLRVWRSEGFVVASDVAATMRSAASYR